MCDIDWKKRAEMYLEQRNSALDAQQEMFFDALRLRLVVENCIVKMKSRKTFPSFVATIKTLQDALK